MNTAITLLSFFIVISPGDAEPQRIYRGLSAGMADVEEMYLNAVFVWGLPDVSSKGFDGRAKSIASFREKGITVFVNSAFPYGKEVRFFAEGKVGQQFKLDYDHLGTYADIWNERYAKVAAKKVPGVFNLTSDEITWNNAHIGYTFYALSKGIEDGLPFYCDSQKLKDEFKKRTGLDYPKLGRSRLLKSNTEQHRQFILFRYRALAEAMARIQKTARTANPDFKSCGMFNLAPVMGLERYHSGLALDVLGEAFTPDFLMSSVFHLCDDYRGPDTHYLAAETAKHLTAANPKSKVIPFTSAQKWGESFNRGQGSKRAPPGVVGKIPYNSVYRGLDMYGINLSAVGQGADGTAMFGRARSLDPKVKRAVARGFRAIARAEAWLAGSKPPGDIVLLYSRAGEDFYGLANEDPKLDATADGSMALREMGGFVQPCNALTAYLGRTSKQTLGFRCQKQMIYFLFKNALPFRMHYLDNLEPGEVESARLLVLPFAHAISKEAFDVIRKAQSKGTKLLILGPLGEIDQKGEPHETPLLKPLVEKLPAAGPVRTDGKVAFVAATAAASKANRPELSKALRQSIELLLENDLTVRIKKSDNAEIEVALRTKSPTDQTVILINWDDELRQAMVSLRVPGGNYRVEVWDVLAEQSMADLKETYTAEELRSFMFNFVPGGAFVMHVSQ